LTAPLSQSPITNLRRPAPAPARIPKSAARPRTFSEFSCVSSLGSRRRHGLLEIVCGGAITGQHCVHVGGTQGCWELWVLCGWKSGVGVRLYYLPQGLVTARIRGYAQLDYPRRQVVEIIFRQPPLIGKKFINQLDELQLVLANPSPGDEDFEIGKEGSTRCGKHHAKETERQFFDGRGIRRGVHR